MKSSTIELIASTMKIYLIKKEMSMPVLIYLIFTEFIISVVCAPKLGHILFDPLSFEAAEFKSKARTTTVDIKEKSNKPVPAVKENNKSEILHSPNMKSYEKKQTINVQTTAETTTKIAAVAIKKNRETNNALWVNPDDETTNNKTDEQTSRTPSQEAKTKSTESLNEKNIYSNFSASTISGETISVVSQISQTDDVSKTNTSSEWLNSEPESRETRTTKHISKQMQEKKAKYKSLDTLPLAVGREAKSIKQLNSKKRLEITSLSELDTRQKDIIITPQKIFMKILRNPADSQDKPENSEKPCAGYDYDVTICQYIGDRYLCGYNKNLGDLKESEKLQNLGNGCRIRGDRMECGYENDNSVNHPVKKLVLKKASLIQTFVKHQSTRSNKPSSQLSSATKSAQTIKTSDVTQLKKVQNGVSSKPKKACMVKDDRLVCFDIPE